MDFPILVIPPEFWWSTDILSSSLFLQGVDSKILPCGQGRIDGVKINPSLPKGQQRPSRQSTTIQWQVVRVESLGGSEVEASGDELEGLATGTSSDIEVVVL